MPGSEQSTVLAVPTRVLAFRVVYLENNRNGGCLYLQITYLQILQSYLQNGANTKCQQSCEDQPQVEHHNSLSSWLVLCGLTQRKMCCSGNLVSFIDERDTTVCVYYINPLLDNG